MAKALFVQWRSALPRLLGGGTSAQQGRLIVLALWLAAAASWAWLIMTAHSAAMLMSDSLTMGLPLSGFLLFWTIMMVAMMFPSAGPMVQAYYAINQRRENAHAASSTAVFIIGYLALSAVSGVAAFGLATWAERFVAHHRMDTALVARLGAGVIIAAGFYQLTPLKQLCLAKCGTPVSFIMTSWRRGLSGALSMGWEHGLYCLGCCWMLFVLLFPLGMMNITVMAAVTALIFAEKISGARWRISKIAAVALIAYGVAILVFPALLAVPAPCGAM